jgi:tetratricopeptide (TPR) repeat protein
MKTSVSKHGQATIDPVAVKPSVPESNPVASPAGASIDFSNWSLDSNQSDSQTPDSSPASPAMDFSNWSLGESDSPSETTQSLGGVQGISNWSLGPSEVSLEPKAEVQTTQVDPPQESAEPVEDVEQETLTPEEWIVMGEEAFAQEDLVNAEKCFLTALVLNPINPIALSNLGVVYHTLGNLEAAEICYLKAVAFDQKSADGFYGLAQMWSDAGHAGLALRYAARGLRRQPEHESLVTIAQDLSRHLDGQLAQLHP